MSVVVYFAHICIPATPLSFIVVSSLSLSLSLGLILLLCVLSLFKCVCSLYVCGWEVSLSLCTCVSLGGQGGCCFTLFIHLLSSISVCICLSPSLHLMSDFHSFFNIVFVARICELSTPEIISSSLHVFF